MTNDPTWQQLFSEQRHAKLGLKARAKSVASRGGVTCLADDEVLLLGGASEAARLSKRPAKGEGKPAVSIALTPAESTDLAALLKEHRLAQPEAEVAGYRELSLPLAERFEGFDRGVFLAGRMDQSFEPSNDLSQAKEHDLGLPLTAVLVYAPGVKPEALAQAADALSGVQGLVSVVPLPAGAGDRIPLEGLTTAGSTDAMVCSVLRILLPIGLRVRASWAALGWKVAQVILAYGADEIAGWGAAETLAYTGRVRAAARVERDELDLGLAEALKEDAGWWSRQKEVQR